MTAIQSDLMAVPRPPWRALAFILVASLGLRLLFALVLPGSIAHSDMLEYHELALSILNDRSFPSILRSPGYPGIVAGVYAIFGVNPQAVYLLQAMIGTLGVLATFVLAIEVLGRQRFRLALLVAALYGLGPGVAYFAGQLLREAWLTLLVPLAALLVLRMMQRDWRYALPLGLTAGAIAWIRMEGGLFIAVALAVGVFHARWRKRALLGGVVAGLIAGASAAPWIMHSAKTRGYASMQNSFGPNIFARTWTLKQGALVEPELRARIQAVVAEAGLSDYEQRSSPYSVAKVLIAELPPDDLPARVALHRRLGAIGYENLANDPLGYVASIPSNLWRMFGGQPFTWWQAKWWPSLRDIRRDHLWNHLALRVFDYAVWPLGVVVLLIVGWIWALRSGDASAWSMSAVVCGALACVVTIGLVNSHGEPRLRVPYDAVLYLPAALGLAVVTGRARLTDEGRRIDSERIRGLRHLLGVWVLGAVVDLGLFALILKTDVPPAIGRGVSILISTLLAVGVATRGSKSRRQGPRSVNPDRRAGLWIVSILLAVAVVNYLSSLALSFDHTFADRPMPPAVAGTVVAAFVVLGSGLWRAFGPVSTYFSERTN